MLAHVGSAPCMLRGLSTISICRNFSLVSGSALRICQVLNIITHHQNNLVRRKALLHELKHNLVNHFLNNDPGFVKGIRTGQNLSRAGACRFWFICFDTCNVNRLPAPRLVNEKNGIFAELPV